MKRNGDVSKVPDADNVTTFPKDAVQRVLTFDGDFLQDLCCGDGWRSLTDELADKAEFISFNMRSFIEQMAARKRRPSARQLALLVGLFADVKVQELLDEMERPEREAKKAAIREKLEAKQAAKGAKVIQLGPYANRARCEVAQHDDFDPQPPSAA